MIVTTAAEDVVPLAVVVTVVVADESVVTVAPSTMTMVTPLLVRVLVLVPAGQEDESQSLPT